jgi:hypothetical protein
MVENISIMKKISGALLDPSKEVGREISAEKTKCMTMSGVQTARQIVV